MINISAKVTKELQDTHLDWVHKQVLKKLYKRKKNGDFYIDVVSPTYDFEISFYEDLAKDPLSNENDIHPNDLLRELILFPPDKLENFKDSIFFSKHTLFTFLCLGKPIRERIDFLEIRESLVMKYPNEMGKEDALSEELRGRLKKIISYDDFTKASLTESRPITDWHAYALTRNLSNLYCPYCNFVATEHVERLVEETVMDGEKIVKVISVLRPSLDHFLDKDNYPFFSVSLFNLIPSCSACNERLKHTTDFGSKHHANPYCSGSLNSVRFVLKNNGIDDEFLRSRYTDGEVDIKKLVITTINESTPTNTTERMNNNFKTFEILSRYNARKEELRQFLELLPLLSEARVHTMSPLKMRGTLKQSVIRENLCAEPDQDNHGNFSLAVIKYNLIQEYAPHLLNE